MPRHLAWRLAALGGGVIALAVSLPVGPAWWRAAAAVALVAAALRPGVAIAACLVLVPWFGHQATTDPYLLWMALTGALGAGLACSRRVPQVDAEHPVLVLAALYVVASIASLVTLPVWEAWEAWRSFPGPELARVFARAQDEQLERSFVSVLFTANGALVAMAMARLATAERAWPRRWAFSIALSVVTAVAVGLADFYGWFDLRVWRPLDPLVNVGQYLRLQSSLGHPGWFGEFLTLGAAWIVVWLLVRVPAAVRSVGLVATLALVQWSLLLSYQRGAWVAHLVVVAGIVAAMARVRGVGRRGAVGRAAFLVAGGLAVAGALVVAADLARGAPLHARMDAIRSRALRITQADDRLPFVEAGVQIGRLWPVLGGGSESFGFRYREQFLSPGGAYTGRGQPPLRGGYGSAHNVYAQVFAGKGVVGLALLLGLCVAVGRASRRVLRDPARSPGDTLAAAAAATSVAGFLVHGLVQEFFYVPSLEFLFWAIIGLAAALEVPRPVAPRMRRLAWVLLAAAVVVHLVHAFVLPGRTWAQMDDWRTTARGERLSGQETDPADGVVYRWTAARAVIVVRPSATLASLSMKGVGPTPQRATLAVDGRPFATLRVDDSAWQTMRVHLPHRRNRGEPYRLEIRVEPTWIDPATGAVRGVKVADYVVR